MERTNQYNLLMETTAARAREGAEERARERAASWRDRVGPVCYDPARGSRPPLRKAVWLRWLFNPQPARVPGRMCSKTSRTHTRASQKDTGVGHVRTCGGRTGTHATIDGGIALPELTPKARRGPLACRVASPCGERACWETTPTFGFSCTSVLRERRQGPAAFECHVRSCHLTAFSAAATFARHDAAMNILAWRQDAVLSPPPPLERAPAPPPPPCCIGHHRRRLHRLGGCTWQALDVRMADIVIGVPQSQSRPQLQWPIVAVRRCAAWSRRRQTRCLRMRVYAHHRRRRRGASPSLNTVISVTRQVDIASVRCQIWFQSVARSRTETTARCSQRSLRARA